MKEHLETLKLKRNETFSIREGWLEKGINIVEEDNGCFLPDNATLSFGLGSNMCKSLRYWLVATRLASTNAKRTQLENLGKTLLVTDRFLEKKISWWLIHISLATNFKDAPVINTFFNMDVQQSDKDYLFNTMKDKFVSEYGPINDGSLESDLSVLLKSYYSDGESNPEDNMSCPLAKLGLVKMRGTKLFEKISPSYKDLDYRAVFYCFKMCLEETNDFVKNKSFNLEDLINRENNPLKILNISKSTLIAYLEEMKKNGLIGYVKTAGLNVVTIKKTPGLLALLK